jgi:trimethylamine:corrinoid methyltransferase-like protein
VELQEAVNGYRAHGNEVNEEHQVAEIDKSLVLECFKKGMKTVHMI